VSYSSNNTEAARDRRRIAILGSGLGGWMAAAVLSRVLDHEHYAIQLLHEPAPAPAPVALATLPVFQKLLTLLGLDERQLMAETRATYSLGAQYSDWEHPGHSYFRGFGPVGARLDGVAFHQHWLRLKGRGEIPPYADYSVAAVAARCGRFAPPLADRRSPFFWSFDASVAGTSDYVALGAEVNGALAGWICWGPTPCTLGFVSSRSNGSKMRSMSALAMPCPVSVTTNSATWPRQRTVRLASP